MRTTLLSALLCAACGLSAGSHEPSFGAPVPVVAPWDTLALPVQGGTVSRCDEAAIVVAHAEPDVAALGGRYAEALRAAGAEPGPDTSAGGMVNQTWALDGRPLALSVQEGGGQRVVQLAFLPR